MYTVSLFETIRDKEKLNEYFLKINYDTLKISKKPDFDSVMVIAVVTEYTGGNAYYHKIERITEGTDSIIVDIHYDSLIYNLKVQQVYTILLLTIPRSDKPVFFRENIVTSAQKPLGRNVGMISERLAANDNRVYDINGRMLLRNQIYSNRLIILSSPYYNEKILFLQKRVDRVK